jgi:hypothetical protein
MRERKELKLLLALGPEDRTVEEEVRVKAHLASCPECAALAQAYAEQDELLRPVPAAHLTRAQRKDLYARVERERRREMFRSRYAAWGATAALVVALVGMVLGARFLLRNGNQSPQEPSTIQVAGEGSPEPTLTSQPTLTSEPPAGTALPPESPWLKLVTPISGQVVSGKVSFEGRTNYTPDDPTVYVYLYDDEGRLFSERWVQIEGTPGGEGTFRGELPVRYYTGPMTLVVTVPEHGEAVAHLTVVGASSDDPLAGMDLVESWSEISPDRRWIAEGWVAFPASGRAEAGYYRRLVVRERLGTREHVVVDAWDEPLPGHTTPRRVAWSDDGRYFYFTARPVPDGCGGLVNGSDLRRLDTETGEVTELLPPSGFWVSLSPDEGTLAYVTWREEDLVVRDLGNGAERRVELDPGEDFTAGEIVWSPGGERLALTVAHLPCTGAWAASTSVLVVDVVTGKARTLLEEDERLLLTARWTEEGILLAERDRFDDPLWLLDPDTGELQVK